MQERDRVIQDQDLLTRRGFAVLATAGLLATGVGSLTLRQAAARETEPGDDRGGHGRDDHGRHHGRHHRRRHG